ncbi:DUF4825 domain-containing protein [Listeria booriae]|uniref:DUF4825 domain-containing protein n=1 Tax=Listeria booriae TaxID=1552123 RepID=UPI00164CF5D9|nr:DUF4825 domain-containing protein [Listeria booriae]MBC6163947.1 DUF4825 domain-containing protein [Listeria booriae]
MKGRRIVFIALGVALFLLAGCSTNSDTPNPTKEDAKVLFENRDTYVGDNSAVSTILQHLYLQKYKQELQLQTQKQPYSMKVTYGLPDAYKTEDIRNMLEKNAAVLFALIPNVDKVTFQFDASSNDSSLNTTYERSTIEKVVLAKLADITKSQADLASFLNVGSK